MDSSELNKVAGAVIGAVLVFMLLGFFSGKVYGTRGHHHDEPQAFALEIEETSVADSGDVAIDYASLIASADLGAGKKVFSKCKACHQVEDGAKGVGPHLWGVVDRPKEAVDGFGYSGALAAIGGEWNFEALNAFLEKPKAYAPKTSMNFGGLKKPEDRVNLIAWLNAEDGTPVDLAAGMEVTAVPAGETEPTTETAAPAEGTQVAAAGAFPAGDAKAGRKVFRKCRACHKADEGANSVGPALWGVINRDIGTADGFEYSDALKALPGNWSASKLAELLTKPSAYANGTKMAFPGLSKEEDRINVITFLNELDGSPEPLE